MEKHLLLAVSGDRAASYNLRFVKNFFTQFCDLRITLLYVAPRPASWTFDETREPEQAALAEMEEAKKAHSHEALEKAWEWLTYRACDPDKVSKKVVHSTLGTVHEIIHEAHRGLYDAVVLGRRGLSWFEELVQDSVSHKILWNDLTFPIWICRRPDEQERRNVLLCVDSSMPAMRVADHVGFILGEKEPHTVTLFHVRPMGVQLSPQVEEMIIGAEKALLDNGFPEKRIEIRIVEGRDVAETIVQEAHSKNYAVVATGRTIDHPSAIGTLVPTSVTTKLLRSLTRCSLWISK